jgi:hypothetical protein
VRNLHLGHIAKSFALRETPGDMGAKAQKTKEAKADDRKAQIQVKKQKMKQRRIAGNEFGGWWHLGGWHAYSAIFALHWCRVAQPCSKRESAPLVLTADLCE